MDTANYLLAKRAELTPGRPALHDLGTGTRYSFAQLDDRANRVANWLLGLGITHGDRVCLLAPNSVIYSDLLHACLKIGAVFTPLNWRLAAPELVYIVNNCTPQVLIVAPEFTAVYAQMAAQLTIPHLATCEGAELPDALIYEETLDQASPAPPTPPAPIQPDDPACILYTSGTTGRPKGALIPQRQILWNAINTVVSWGLTSEDISPIFTPMFHSGGLFVFLTPLHYVGGQVIITRTFELEESLRVIEQEGCTVILGVPTIFQMWLDSPAFAQTSFASVRWFISGGAPCPPELAQAWQQATGRVLRQGYGLTEVGTNCFTMTDEEAQMLVGSVGQPIFHSEMKLVNEAGQDVPQGEIGELLIAGPHVCAGYLHNPEATAVSIQNGWFHTGDMARQDETGYFYIVGRFKDMIISGGENVYAAEVEAIFREHTAVQECALIGLPDDTWGEVGLMITVLDKNCPATPELADELRAFCKAQLASYKVPKQIIFVPELPYSPYGKVEKLVLKEKYAVT